MSRLAFIGFGAALALLVPACGGPQRPPRPNLPPPVYEHARPPDWQKSPGAPVDVEDDEAFEEDPEYDTPPSKEPEPAEPVPEPEPEVAPAEPTPAKDPLAPISPPDAPKPSPDPIKNPMEPLPIETPKADPLRADRP